MENLYTIDGVMQDKEVPWSRYTYLVRHEALRLKARLPACVELDDLLQSGMIALIQAAQSYDSEQGVSFNQYATQRIRWALLDELRERDWVPRSVRRHAREIANAIQRVEQRKGGVAAENEIAAELNMDLEQYQQRLADTNSSYLFSLDELKSELGDSVETIEDQHVEQDPLQQLLNNNLKQRVMQELSRLPQREQLLLNLYYQQELNLKEIGLLMGVSESRVSQLHSQTLKRLKARLRW